MTDVWDILRDSRRTLIAISGFAVLAGLLEAFLLYLLAHLALSITSSQETIAVVGDRLDWHPRVPQALTAALIATVLWALFGLAAAFLEARASTRTLVGLQTRLTSSFLDASYDVQATERQGRLQELVSNGPSVALMVMHVATGLFALVNVLVLVGAAVLISPIVSLVLIGGMGILFGLLMPLAHRTHALSSSKAQANIDLAEGVAEAVSTSREVRLLDVTGPVTAHIQGRIQAVARPYLQIKFLARMVPVLYQGAALGLIVTGLTAIHEFGANNVAELSGVILLLVRATTFGSLVQTALQSLSDVVPVALLIQRQESAYRQTPASSGDEAVEHIEKLELDKVSFGYDPKDILLRGISLSIHAGESVAVVGATGAGKSTLVQLLLRLRKPTSGSYRVNGIEASLVDSRTWAKLVALAPQDGRLFRGTVADNIAFFRTGLKPEEIRCAAEAAHLKRDLLSWPAGIGTQVGTRGEAISGGQAQRINIARALIGKPDLLVLDEPTSAVDSETERAILDTLRTLKGKITLIVIAHRQTTISLCDRILEVRDGDVLDRPAIRV